MTTASNRPVVELPADYQSLLSEKALRQLSDALLELAERYDHPITFYLNWLSATRKLARTAWPAGEAGEKYYYFWKRFALRCGKFPYRSRGRERRKLLEELHLQLTLLSRAAALDEHYYILTFVNAVDGVLTILQRFVTAKERILARDFHGASHALYDVKKLQTEFGFGTPEAPLPRPVRPKK